MNTKLSSGASPPHAIDGGLRPPPLPLASSGEGILPRYQRREMEKKGLIIMKDRVRRLRRLTLPKTKKRQRENKNTFTSFIIWQH